MPDAFRTVLKYYLYRATSGPGFTYPIYTLFLLLNGLSYTQIGIIATVQSIIVVAGEVPTGYVGDRIGRRNSLFIAAVLFFISNAGYLVAKDFWGFLFVFGTLPSATRSSPGAGARGSTTPSRSTTWRRSSRASAVALVASTAGSWPRR